MSRTTIPLALLAAVMACVDAAPTALDSERLAGQPGAGGQLSVADPCAGDRGASANETVFPSPEHRTLQSAVCAVNDGGTVHVLAGTYDERVTIWGKDITIQGAGNEEEPSLPAVNAERVAE